MDRTSTDYLEDLQLHVLSQGQLAVAEGAEYDDAPDPGTLTLVISSTGSGGSWGLWGGRDQARRLVALLAEFVDTDRHWQAATRAGEDRTAV